MLSVLHYIPPSPEHITLIVCKTEIGSDRNKEGWRRRHVVTARCITLRSRISHVMLKSFSTWACAMTLRGQCYSLPYPEFFGFPEWKREEVEDGRLESLRSCFGFFLTCAPHRWICLPQDSTSLNTTLQTDKRTEAKDLNTPWMKEARKENELANPSPTFRICFEWPSHRLSLMIPALRLGNTEKHCTYGTIRDEITVIHSTGKRGSSLEKPDGPPASFRFYSNV